MPRCTRFSARAATVCYRRGGQGLHQLRHDHAAGPRGCRGAGGERRCEQPGSLHGQQHHPGARWTLYLMLRRARRGLPARRSAAGEPEHLASLHRLRGNGGAGEGAGQHGDEHQHRRACRGPGPWGGAGARSGNAQTVFSQTGANSRVLETDGEDMVIRDTRLTSRAPTRPRTRHRPVAGRRRRSRPAVGAGDEAQYDKMIAIGRASWTSRALRS